MKIYTKTGDTGETGLIGGQRTSKTDPRIEAIGTVDELNAYIGLLQSSLSLGLEDVERDLQEIQHHLFDVGAMLANLSEKKGRSVSVPKLTASTISQLEKRIDTYDEELTKLTAFILPGGGQPASVAHIARAVCRRAERCIVALQSAHTVDPHLLQYINRLSDYLFTIARLANKRSNLPDIFWQQEKS